MKTFWIFGIVLSFGLVPLGHSNDEATDFSSMRAAYQNLKMDAAFRKNCIRHQKAGRRLGERTYKQIFPTCTDFLLASQSFTSFFGPRPVFEDAYDNCFESGYREGFVRKGAEEWLPCTKQLSEALDLANKESIEDCRKLGRKTFESLRSLVMEEANGSQDEVSLLESEEFARIVFFADSGFGEKVWEDLLRLGQKRQKDIFACNLSFSQELLGMTP